MSADPVNRLDGIDAATNYVPGKEHLPGSRQSSHALFKTYQCLGSGMCIAGHHQAVDRVIDLDVFYFHLLDPTIEF